MFLEYLQKAYPEYRKELSRNEKLLWDFSSGKKSKKRVFEELFHQKFHADKDQLWRDELKNFKKRLLQLFFLNTCSSKELKRYFLEQNHPTKIWEKEYALWEKYYPVDNELLNDFFEKSYSQQIQKDKSLLSFHAYLGEKLHQLKKEQMEQDALWDRRMAFLERLLRVRDLTFEKRKVPEINNYMAYLELRTKAFQATGKAEIFYLEKALTLVMKIERVDFDNEKERIGLLNNLAVQHFLLGNYKISNRYYSELIEISDMPALKLNYLTNLIKMETYVEAVRFLESGAMEGTNEEQIDVKIKTVAPMIYLLSGKTEQAQKVLPHQVKFGINTDYLYARMVYISYYIATRNLDLMERECLNFKRVAKKSIRFSAYLNYIKIVEGVFLKEKQHEKMKHLLEEFTQIKNELTEYLPVIYLKKEIEKRFS